MKPLRTWADAAAHFDLTETAVVLSDAISFRITHVRDLNAILDGMTQDDFGPDERLPYWATLWPSAIELARRLIEDPRPGPAIELGSGLGLGAIALAHSGIAQPLATDYEQEALLFAAHNAEQNGVQIETRQLDWRELARGGKRSELTGRFRTVVGSDVLYEARQVEPLALSLSRLLAPGGRAVIADPGRPHWRDFCAALEAEGLAVEEERQVNGILFLEATR